MSITIDKSGQMLDIEYIKNKFGNEMAAIILCCRVFFKTATTDELKAFVANNDIDWYTLVRLTLQHRIRPTVYKVLYDVDIPPDIRVLIYKQHTDITQLNWKHALETERIILLLKEKGIEAIPYKGAAFSKQFFGDLVSRESSDIDLIIRPEDIDGAIRVLKSDAYLPEMDDVYQYLGTKYCAYYKDYNLNKFKNGAREFHIELHWAIAENYLSVNNKVNSFIFDDHEQVELVKCRVAALKHAAHFSAIVVHHSIKDTFKYLKNITDISQAIKQPNINTTCLAISESFAGMGLKKALGLSDLLCKQLMGICLLQTDDLTIPVNTVDHFVRQLCSDRPLPVENKLNTIFWLRNRILLQDSFVQRSKFFWVTSKHRFIPTEADYKVFKLPAYLFFIYYFTKPFRSVLKPQDVIERKKALIPVS